MEQVAHLRVQEMLEQIAHLLLNAVHLFILPKAAVPVEEHHLRQETLEVQVVELQKAHLAVELQHNRVNQAGNGGTGKDLSGVFGTSVGNCGWFASGGGGGVNNPPGTGGCASAGGGTDGGPIGGGGGPVSCNAQANTGGGSGGGGCGHGGSGNGGPGVIVVKEPTIAGGVWQMSTVYDNVKAGTWTN